MTEDTRRIGWLERRDGALVGIFFGCIATAVYLVIAALLGLAGGWHSTAESFRDFFVAQLAFAPLMIIGASFLGALWDLRRSRSGRIILWLIGGIVLSGSLVSLAKAPLWRWDWRTLGWVIIMAPAWAWVFASGSVSRRRSQPPGQP